MDNAQDIRPLIGQVVEARRLAALAQETLAELRQQWETDNQAAIQWGKTRQEQLAIAEGLLREAALAVYAATGEKQVAPGVAIRVNRRSVYELAKAEAWSKEHGGIAHVFDPKTFEGLARAGQAADIVRFEDAPIATLAKSLTCDPSSFTSEG